MTCGCLQVTGQPEVDPPAEEVGYAPVPPQAGTPPQQCTLSATFCRAGPHLCSAGSICEAEATEGRLHAASRFRAGARLNFIADAVIADAAYSQAVLAGAAAAAAPGGPAAAPVTVGLAPGEAAASTALGIPVPEPEAGAPALGVPTPLQAPGEPGAVG